MMTLALEFSSPWRSVALYRLSGSGAPPEIVGSLSDQGSKVSRPLPLVQELLDQGGIGLEQIEAIVVGLGPGSYTGIRSAVALAQGWQLARGIKTCGVGSVETLAFEAQRQGWFGEVSVAIDAQRQEFYLATYSIALAGRELVEPLRLVNLAALQARAAQPGGIVVGPEVIQWIPSGRNLFPPAEALAHLADPIAQHVPAETLQPIYLREVTFVKAPPARIVPG